jgi:hypothetical protein
MPIGVVQAEVMPTVLTSALVGTKARAAGATHVNVRQRGDGGFLLHGQLDGRNFVIDIPPDGKVRRLCSHEAITSPECQ